MDTKNFALLEMKADESGVFEGKLAVYGNRDEQGDVLEPGSLSKTLREGGGSVPLLWQHDTRNPIGTLELRDTPTALLAKGRLVLSVPAARQAYDLLRAGVVRGMSIGFRVIKENFTGEVRRLKEIRLYEGSLVTFGANPEALVTSVKADEPGPDLEALDAFRNAARDISAFHRSLIDGD
jgi:uncharacterized protein